MENQLSPFVARHVGPRPHEIDEMLKTLGYSRLEDLTQDVVPASIRYNQGLDLPPALTEAETLAHLKKTMSENKVLKSLIGMGYSGTLTPPVILRNVLENPGWYTQYTPYQAEISQGRLEALLNFQTLVAELTGMEIANASLLDEGTAAAEAMTLCQRVSKSKSTTIFVSESLHPQTLAVIKARALPLGIQVLIGDPLQFRFESSVFAVVLGYPDTYGDTPDFRQLTTKAHDTGALVIVVADLLALTLLEAPGSWGADVVVGSAQRFGVPMGFGGPHAAFMSTRDEFKRQIPGRLVGVSKDRLGNSAMRLALQPREQHIRREKATSNICTAQVLLAVMASMYAVYHGPKGLRDIAQRIHKLAGLLATGVREAGHHLVNAHFFDTLSIRLKNRKAEAVRADLEAKGYNIRVLNEDTIGVSLDETCGREDVEVVLTALGGTLPKSQVTPGIPTALVRKTPYLEHPTFNRYQSETEMLRYIFRLQGKDLSLTSSMIPLGSCTMKLNATAEMIPVTWPEVAHIHPFAPASQTEGYRKMLASLEWDLSQITGFDAVSLQPNSGSQGEYAGLLCIRQYHVSRGEPHRQICLIPSSAHGTNPASAVMAGMKVVVVACDQQGNVDLADLRTKAELHAADLAALMVTYPSTHGVFEEEIREICNVIHRYGGQVYLDGANMNAQVGLCRPGDYGADVCHLNLHKTFCIPHGGGGPGMGPIGVKKHLADFLPNHPLVAVGGRQALGPVSAAPWGSASILPISWAYIRMMGATGLRQATQVAILNANYIAKRLDQAYPVLYKGQRGLVAHECILDLREIKERSGVEVEDLAKRLMDYGFHAPTVSFPVVGTVMIEPTESEGKAELDRFCDAMLSIRKEIAEIESGRWDREANPLKNAPHTMEMVLNSQWDLPYSREVAARPSPSTRDSKFWPSVARVDNAYGDRNLVCACPPMTEYESAP